MAKKRKDNKVGIDINESKADRFKRVATPRIRKAVKAINVIGYCSSKAYEYTPEQIEKITEVLFAAVNGLVDSFADRKGEGNEFNFPD